MARRASTAEAREVSVDARLQASPPSRAETRAPRTAGNSFVIQQHAARRLHYDFRLELDGVLLSWSVPKGPSLSPTERRLAVRTEDHPLDYADFEGIIPQGQYGGGTVVRLGSRHVGARRRPREAMKQGRLTFTLDGEKLHGKWHLVRTKPHGQARRTGCCSRAATRRRTRTSTSSRATRERDHRPHDRADRRDADRVWQSNRPRTRSRSATTASPKRDETARISATRARERRTRTRGTQAPRARRRRTTSPRSSSSCRSASS